MRGKKFSLALVLSLVMALGVVGLVSAQTAPVTVTIPEVDAAGVISTGTGFLAGGIFALLVTMAGIRNAPAIVGAVRRLFGAAT